jgi:PAS domain S-box-containing protein
MDSGTGTKTSHILLLEDDRAHRDLVLRAFRDDPEPFRVSLAGTIREARQAIESDPPDLIIADWILPDGKGLDILPRRDGKVTIPLIIMTSFGDEHLAVEIMKSGAIDYVVKSATVFKDLPHIARRALHYWENIRERKRAEETVQESQKRLADIISFLPDAVLAIDNDGRVIAWNGAIERMTGVTAADMLGKGDHAYSIPFYGKRRPILIDLVLMDDGEVEKKYDYIQRENGRITSETFIPTLFGGKGAYLWGTATPLYDTTGNRVGAIEVIRDITERKRVELDLVYAQQKLKEAHNLAHIGTWDWVMENDIVTWSEEIYSLAGRDPSLPAPTYAEHLHIYTPSSWDRLSSSVTRALTTGKPYNLELELIHLDGSIRWVIAFGGVKRDLNGKIIGLHGTVQDITERKQAELALQVSEIRFKDLFNNMSAGVSIYDVVDDGEDFIFKDINHAVERIEKVSKEDLVGRSVLDVFPGVKEFGLFAVFQRVAKTGIAELHPVSIYKDNRIAGWRENYVYKLPSGEVVALYEDVTEKKQAEENLRVSEERFRHISGLITNFAYSCTRPPGGVFSIDWITEAVGRITGFAPDEILAMGCWRGIVVDEDLQVFDEKIAGLLPVMSSQCELRIRAKDGAIRGLKCFAECVSDPVCPTCHTLYGGCQDFTDKKQAEGALRESEERYRLLADNIADVLWVLDIKTGKWTYMSPSAERLRGYTVEEVLAQSIEDVMTPASYAYTQKILPERVQRFLSDESGMNCYLDEIEQTCRDGTTIWTEVATRYLRNEQGELTLLGLSRDIGERKRAETALRESETRFRVLIQNSSDIIRILDRDGLIVYESESSERILGYPAGYLIGKNPMEYIYPEDLEHVKKDFREVIDQVNPGTPTEFRIRKADGEYLWVDSIGTNLLDVPGVNGIVITTRPIQQRKEAEQALLENQARLATAMDIAGLVNWEFDVATGMFTFDDRFYALYETTADREGGNRMPAETYMQEFVHSEDRPAVLASIQKILATTDPDYFGQIEHRITPRDGSVRTIIARFAPVIGPDGTVIRTIGANQDITDRILMESEIRSLNTVLEQRVRDRTEALAKTNEALEEEIAQRQEAEKKLQGSYDEKVMLLKEIHHRVKNNLQIIASLLNLQSRYIKDESTLAAIRESQNRVKAMALVHEKLYRSEDISHVSLHDYIRFLGTGLFQFYDAKLRGIQFTLDIHEVNVDIDAAIPLGLILNELISNSLKYAFPEGRKGEIAISVKKEDHTITILFRDTGIGIPADLDWRDTQSLGLRLVNTLVDQMNGTVELDRSSGTQFTMVLHEKEQRGPS